MVVSLSVACVLTVSEEGSLIAPGHSKMLLVRAIAPSPRPCQYNESQHIFTWSETLLSEQALLEYTIGGRAMLVHAVLWTSLTLLLPKHLSHCSMLSAHCILMSTHGPLPSPEPMSLRCPALTLRQTASRLACMIQQCNLLTCKLAPTSL